MNDYPLFKIIDGDKRYIVYTDGRTEGFEQPIIVNYYHAHVHEEIEKFKALASQ